MVCTGVKNLLGFISVFESLGKCREFIAVQLYRIERLRFKRVNIALSLHYQG